MKKPKKGYKFVKSLFGKYDEIPNEWNEKKIKKIIEIPVTDGPHTTPEFLDSGIPFISAEAIKNSQINFDFATFISIEDHKKFCKKANPQRNDIFMVKAGNTTGKIAQVETDIEFSIWSPLGLIRINDENFHRFFYHFFLSYWFQKQIKSNFNTTTQPNIGMGQIEKLLVYTPPKPEQEKIALILDKIYERIKQIEEIIQTAEVLKKGLLEKLISSGINDEKTKEERFTKNGIISLGHIPKSWEFIKIKDLKKSKHILEIQDGNHGELHPTGEDFQMKGIPFITADCFIANHIDYKKCAYLDERFLKELRIGFAKQDDVLLTHKGSIGLTSLVNTHHKTIILSPQVTYYRLSEKLDPKFLHYVFQSNIFQKQLKILSKQSTRDYVGITKQGSISIPIPTVDEEQVLISEKLSSIDSNITIQKEQKSGLENIKKGLMQKLLTGEMRVKV
jgi:type I restriction enzyme, S subunit